MYLLDKGFCIMPKELHKLFVLTDCISYLAPSNTLAIWREYIS